MGSGISTRQGCYDNLKFLNTYLLIEIALFEITKNIYVYLYIISKQL